jgi:hypothetical protein
MEYYRLITGKLAAEEERVPKPKVLNLLIVMKLMFMLLIAFTASGTQAQPSQPINITFKANEIGKFPSGWASMNGNGAAKIYSVKTEGEHTFLHADAPAMAVPIGTEHSWALKDLPILQWQWRAVLFPDGTNEHDKNRNDSVLAVYVAFGHLPFINTIKYIWSDTIPVGTMFTSSTASNTKIIVIRSGRAQINTWVTEKRDVFADYRQIFGEKEKDPIATGIIILTDSDNTATHAIGDYGCLQVLGSNGEVPKP